jgi:hypothetical protein
MAESDWSQGLIAHVWGGKGDVLCIDPATGIRNSQKVTTRYNDFQNLKWLGLRNGQTPIFNTSESGRWVCVEAHVRLNTPGKEDGVFELWVDGKLEAARTDLNWHGDWQEYAINAFFLENYWNDGSGKRQARWFDNLVISTAPIGPITAANPPALTRTRTAFENRWEVEVAADSEGRDIVWRSRTLDASVLDLVVDASHGRFSGSRAGLKSLAPRVAHWVRIRFVDSDAWSPWHAPFKAHPSSLAVTMQLGAKRLRSRFLCETRSERGAPSWLAASLHRSYPKSAARAGGVGRGLTTSKFPPKSGEA